MGSTVMWVRKTPTSPCGPIVAAALTIACLSLKPAAAEDPVASLRRVFVPADRLAELGERYPDLQSLSRDEFEDLVRRARQAGQPPLMQVESANYQAVLEGDRLVGTADLVVRGNREARSMVRWPASRWSIAGARWESGEASIGYLGRGELGLAVPAGDSHRLSFNWIAPTQAFEAGQRIDFKIPQSLWGELALDLPRGTTPVSPTAQASGPTNAPRADLQRWLLRWSPADALRCLLLKDDAARALPSLLTYAREMEADISDEATELLARFDIFVGHQPVRRLEFDTAPGLKLFGWSGLKIHDWQERDNRVQLDLAEPLIGPAQLTVRGLAAGPADGLWRLPRLELRDSIWTGGNTRTRGALGLTLFDAQVTAGRVLGNQDTASGRPELLVEHTAADAGFSVRVSADLPQVFARVHTSVEVAHRLRAVAALRWQIASGELHVLKVRVPAAWSVEDVEASPPGILAGWSVQPDPADGLTASLRLSRALTAADSTISAQIRLLGPESDASTPNFEFLIPRIQPIDAHAGEEVVSIETKQLWSAELIEPNQVTLIPRPTAPGTGAADKPAALNCRFDGPNAKATVAVRRQAPDLLARIDASAELDGEMVEVNYLLDVEMPSGQPDWLDVNFRPTTGSDLSWDLVEGIRAERIEEEPVAGDSEIWRIFLPRKPLRRVRLNASWRSAVGESRQIPLPTVQRATSSGQVVVNSPPELDFEATTRDLAPAASASDNATKASTKQWLRTRVWRYGPGSPQLTLRTISNSDANAAIAFVNQALLRTVLNPDGQAIHTVRFDIHSKRAIDFTIRLPSGSQLRDARCDGLAVKIERDNELHLKGLPPVESFQVEVQYVVSGPALGGWSKREFTLPEISLPCLRFTWELDASPDYRAISWSDELTATPPRAAKSWLARLFGPLAREADEGPFKFWQAHAWQAWWKTQTEPAYGDFVARIEKSLEGFQRDVLPRDRTWARLITHFDQFADHRLVIDAVGLKESGIDLSDRAAFSKDESADDLLGLARSSELNILKTKRGLLLTSREEAGNLARSNAATGLRSLDSERGLAQAIDEAVLHGSDASGRFVLAHQWTNSGTSGRSLVDTHVAESPSNDHVLRFDSLSLPSLISVTLVEDFLLAQATTFVVVLAILCAFVRRTRPTRGFVRGCSLSIALAFVLAIRVPEPLSVPAAALAWSQLVVVFIWSRLPSGERRIPQPIDSGNLPSTVSQAGVAGAILVAALLPVQKTSGQQEEKAAASSKTSLVFIPFDPAAPEKRNDATRVLVPRATYDRLVELAKTSAENVDRVLVRSATCMGKMAADRLNLAIDLDLESFASEGPARCALPLAGAIIRSAQLDGKACLLGPNPDGVTVEVMGGGNHRLHIESVLALDSVAGDGFFDVTIPPSPVAKLNLEFPPDIALELDEAVPSAEWVKEPEKQQLRAELGAAGRIAAHWSRGPVKPAELSVNSATLLTWTPGAVRLEVRTHVNVESGVARKLVLEPDPRLLLERIRAPGMTGCWWRPGEKLQLIVEFDHAIEKSVLLRMQFLIAERPGEKLAVPEVRVIGAHANQKMMAVLGEPTPNFHVSDPMNVSPAAAADFQGLWGEPLPRGPELLILQLATNSPAPAIEQKHAATRPLLRMHEELHVRRTRLDLVTQISGEPRFAKSFRHELSLPAGLTLENVRVSPGTQWRQVAADRLLWFGLPAADSTPSIELQAWLPREGDSGPLPIVRPLGDCQLAGEVTVWQGRDVNISLLDARGLKSKPLRPDLKPPAAHLMAKASFEVEGPDLAATLTVQRLTPRLSATVASRILIDEEGAEWVSVVEYQVADGSFSQLQLRLAGNISEALQIVGEGIVRREAQRDGAEQIWTIQLDAPRWGSYRVVLRARIGAEQNGSLTVPAITPLQVVAARKLLLLLNASDQTISLAGLENQQAISGEGFSRWFSEPITKSVLGAFELREPLGQVVLRRISSAPAGHAMTTLIERSHAWLSPTGSLLVESSLLIRARSEGTAVLVIPETATVLEITVDGQAMPPNRNPAGAVSVFLEADDRPHEVRLWWFRDLPKSRGESATKQIEIPRLTTDDAPAVWTISTPAQWRIASSSAPTTCRSLVEATETAVIAEELEQLLGLQRPPDVPEHGSDLWDLEQSFVCATDRLRRVLETEAEVELNGRELRRDHQRANLQFKRLVGQNHQVLDRVGLSSLRARAEAQLPRVSPPTGSLLVSSSTGHSTGNSLQSARALSPPPSEAAPIYFSTDDQNLVLSLHSTDFKTTLIEWAPAVLFGLFIWIASLWLVGSGGQRFAIPRAIAALAVLWCWRLKPEPVGPALLLVALIVALVILVRARGRSRSASSLHATG